MCVTGEPTIIYGLEIPAKKVAEGEAQVNAYAAPAKKENTMIVPIKDQEERVVGVFEVSNATTTYTLDDRYLADTFVQMAGLLISRFNSGEKSARDTKTHLVMQKAYKNILDADHFHQLAFVVEDAICALFGVEQCVCLVAKKNAKLIRY